jgi:replicative DNA helicase
MDAQFEIDNSIEAVESKLISELLNDPNTIEEAILKLEPTDFSNKQLASIFGAIMKLNQSGKSSDEHTVIEYLNSRKENQFDDYQMVIRALSSKFANSIDVSDHIDLIKNASIKRQLNEFGTEISTTKIDFTGFEGQISNLEKRFTDIIHSKRSSKINSISEIADDYKEQLTSMLDRDDQLRGITSGYSGIDKLTNGFQPGDLIILAARPGVGKTALALNFILNAARDIVNRKNNNDVILMFSLEMGANQLLNRLVSNVSMVNLSNVHANSLSNMDLIAVTEAIEEVKQLPICIDDTSDSTILDIQSKVKQLKMTHNIKLVVVDYMQLLKGPETRGQQVNRQQEVANISRMLKQIARQNETPVLAVAQLSRNIELRKGTDAEPKLSDLRESGAIEQDADLVTFIVKESAEQPTEQNPNPQPAGANVMVEYIIAKHRNGPTGYTKLQFSKSTGRYVE